MLAIGSDPSWENIRYAAEGFNESMEHVNTMAAFAEQMGESFLAKCCRLLNLQVLGFTVVVSHDATIWRLEDQVRMDEIEN